MVEQFLGAVLFLFGFQNPWGSVRGESTPSALTASTSATNSSSVKKFKPIIQNDIVSFERNFAEKKKATQLAWEAKRASFSASLKAVKDEKKKERLETLQNRLTEINANQTSFFMSTLKRLDKGVSELQAIAQQYATKTGKDLSGVSSALEAANKEIADAVSKVTAQAEKTYVITVTSETNLKDDFGKARSALAGDLKKARDSVHNARKKVGEAHKALKNATGEPVKILIQTENIPTPSVSPSGTPTPGTQ